MINWIVYNFTRFDIAYNLIFHSIWFNNGSQLCNKMGNDTSLTGPHDIRLPSILNFYLNFMHLNFIQYTLCMYAICTPYSCLPYACTLYYAMCFYTIGTTMRYVLRMHVCYKYARRIHVSRKYISCMHVHHKHVHHIHLRCLTLNADSLKVLKHWLICHLDKKSYSVVVKVTVP